MLKLLTVLVALVAIAYAFVFAIQIDPYYNYVPTYQDSIKELKINPKYKLLITR